MLNRHKLLGLGNVIPLCAGKDIMCYNLDLVMA